MPPQSLQCQQLLDMLRDAPEPYCFSNFETEILFIFLSFVVCLFFKWNLIYKTIRKYDFKPLLYGTLETRTMFFSIIKGYGLSLDYNVALGVRWDGFERFCLDLETKSQWLAYHTYIVLEFVGLAESLLRTCFLKRFLLLSASNWVN